MAEQNLNSDGIWDGTPGSLEAGAGADEDGGLDDQGVAEMLRREVAWMRVWKAEWEKTSEI